MEPGSKKTKYWCQHDLLINQVNYLKEVTKWVLKEGYILKKNAGCRGAKVWKRKRG
jgi:hypothetical protein